MRAILGAHGVNEVVSEPLDILFEGPVPPKIDAVNCRFFYAATILGSETMIFFMQLHLP